MPLYLALEPIYIGMLIVPVVFGPLTLFQLIKARTKLLKQPSPDDYPRYFLVVFFLLLTTISLLAWNALKIIVLVHPGPDWQSYQKMSYIQTMTGIFARAFFLTAISVILDWRCHQQVEEGHGISRQFATAIRVALSTFISIMFLGAVGRAVLAVVITDNLDSFESEIAYRYAYYVVVAAFVLATMTIWGTVFIIYENRKPLDCSLELLQFDGQVLIRIACPICPLLAARTLLSVISEVVQGDLTFRFDIDLGAFLLAGYFIDSSLMFALISAALNLGLPAENEPPRTPPEMYLDDQKDPESLLLRPAEDQRRNEDNSFLE